MTQPTVRDIERRIDDEGQMKFLKEYSEKQSIKKANRKPLLQKIKQVFKGLSR